MKSLLLPPFENVGAGQKAIMPRLPQGETYHGILLELGGTFTKAQIDRIAIRLGGKLIWDVTGSQLDSINQYMGMTASATHLLIPFSEFNARTILGETIGAIDTSIPYAGFSIEVDINAAATSPTLKAWRLVTNRKVVADENQRPLFKVMLPATHNKGAAGKYNLPIPMGSKAGGMLKAVHCFHSNITQVDVKLDGEDVLGEGTLAAAQFWQNNLTRVTQSGHFAFDTVIRDNQSETIPTVRADGMQANLEFYATLSAPDTVNTISEMYAPIGNI